MDIKTALEKSIQSNQVDMQALILFLVMEKQVLKMDDDAKELDLYFKENNRKRMNQELRAYKQKLKMKYKPNVYKVLTTDRVLYIYAKDAYECNSLASTLSSGVLSIKVSIDNEMLLNGEFEAIKSITRNKQTPFLLGWNRSEQLYKQKRGN